MKKRPGPKPSSDAERRRPVLKIFWRASDQLCGKRLPAALPEWLEHYGPGARPLSAQLRKQRLTISPAQIDRLRQPRQGLATTKPGSLLRMRMPTCGGPPDTSTLGQVEADTVAHCGDTTAGDFVYSLTFTTSTAGGRRTARSGTRARKAS